EILVILIILFKIILGVTRKKLYSSRELLVKRKEEHDQVMKDLYQLQPKLKSAHQIQYHVCFFFNVCVFIK
ncbi:hypothetical protein SGI37_20445, partial [Providencia rettgeri]